MRAEDQDSSYWDDPKPELSDYKARFRKYLLIAVVGSFLLVFGNTLAANINLNPGTNVEFGQGISLSTSCDSQINYVPVSTFTDNLWTVENGSNVHSDGFWVTDFVVSDIANSCMGKQFIINAYGDSSSTPLNADPLRINYSSAFGGFFSFDVDTPNSVQAFLGQVTIDTSTAGLGNRGTNSEKGSSTFHLGDWASLYSNPGQVDARLVKKYTIQTQDIPSNSLSLKSGTYSVTAGRTLDSRTIWVKGLYVKSLGHADDILPNTTQSGISIKQPFWIYVPTDASRNVTKTAYTFSGSTNIACADNYANGDAGWIYECTPNQNNWELNINYSGP